MRSVTHRVVDRPHAGAVARQHQALTARVPDGEGEVAVERLDAIGTPLLVEMDDDLGVGRRLEHVAAGDQLGAQLDVVEDLAVEGDPNGAVLVAHRLPAAVEIDDAEARVGEADVAVDESAVAVRTAMRQRCRSCGPAVRGAPRAPRAVDSSRQCRTCRMTLPLRKLSADKARPRLAGKAGEQRARPADLGQQSLVARVHDHGGNMKQHAAAGDERIEQIGLGTAAHGAATDAGGVRNRLSTTRPTHRAGTAPAARGRSRRAARSRDSSLRNSAARIDDAPVQFPVALFAFGVGQEDAQVGRIPIGMQRIALAQLRYDAGNLRARDLDVVTPEGSSGKASAYGPAPRPGDRRRRRTGSAVTPAGTLSRRR